MVAINNTVGCFRTLIENTIFKNIDVRLKIWKKKDSNMAIWFTTHRWMDSKTSINIFIRLTFLPTYITNRTVLCCVSFLTQLLTKRINKDTWFTHCRIMTQWSDQSNYNLSSNSPEQFSASSIQRIQTCTEMAASFHFLMWSCYTCRTKPKFWLAICPVFVSRAATEPVLLLRCEGLLTWHGVLSFPGAQWVRGQPRDALLPYHAPQPRQTVPHLGRGRDDRRPRQHQLKGHSGACWERWVRQASPRRRRRVKRGCVKVMREISCTPIAFIPSTVSVFFSWLLIDSRGIDWVVGTLQGMLLLIMWWWTGAI